MLVDRYKVGQSFGVSIGNQTVTIKVLSIRGQSVDLGISRPEETQAAQSPEPAAYCTPEQKA